VLFGNRNPVDAVKARLLPLAPREAAMERLIEKFPRRPVASRLVPFDGVTVVDEKKGEYKSSGADACFALNLDDPDRRGGWFYVEAALVRHNGNRLASLRVETSDKADRSFDWPITTNLRGSVREVVYLPPDVTRLLWFPTGAPGFFSHSPLLVHKISWFEGAARRLHRVLLSTGQYRPDPAIPSQGQGLWSALSHLQKAYRQTADLRASRARGINYPAFLAHAEKFSKNEMGRMREQAAGLSSIPLISIFMVLRNPVPEYLAKTIDSVVSQMHSSWELFVCADARALSQVGELLQLRQAADPRIKLLPVMTGQSVAEGLNQALHAARGEYAVRLGQHDVVHAHALLHVALAVAEHPGASLIYTDEDTVDALGTRFDPAFKPDWNADLLLSYNYIASMAVYRTKLAMTAGGYRNGFDEAEDYDLLLRLSREIEPEAIWHIPKVLYSRWVMERKATSDAPHLSHLSGLRALQEHLLPAGANAVSDLAASVYRVSHPVPTPPPLVTLIIPTRDKVEILKKCIESIQHKTDYPNWEMLVVDNGSVEPETHEYLREITRDARIRVLAYDKPFNYSAINNFAARMAKGDILALLNNDLEVIAPQWLREMVSHAIRREIGAVGAKLLYPDGAVQHAGVVLGIGGVAGHVHRFLPGDDPGYCYRASVTQNLSAVTGACMLVRKALYWQVGGLNEASLAVAFNDIDLCLKLRDAGYRNLYTPYALLTHHESLSRGRDDTEEKNQTFRQEYAYMQDTWQGKLRDDPAYNVNLTTEFENFSFANPA
jgi:O-antigen biosynthesis protein